MFILLSKCYFLPFFFFLPFWSFFLNLPLFFISLVLQFILAVFPLVRFFPSSVSILLPSFPVFSFLQRMLLFIGSFFPPLHASHPSLHHNSFLFFPKYLFFPLVTSFFPSVVPVICPAFLLCFFTVIMSKVT